MRFQTYMPCDALRPFVKYFVISENEVETTYKVLPDTALVAGFQYRGKLLHLEQGRPAGILLAPSGITGLLDSYRVFKNSAGVGSVLVYFREAAAPAFFGIPADELFGESVSLDNFLAHGALLTLEGRLSGARHDTERISLVEQFLIAAMRHTSPDELVAAAVTLIYQSDGNIRISELAGRLYISQSRLEKRFRAAVGASPKRFSSLVRLKCILKTYRPGISMTEVAYASGFYDQAHFTSEFKKFTGDTPEGFFLHRMSGLPKASE